MAAREVARSTRGLASSAAAALIAFSALVPTTGAGQEAEHGADRGVALLLDVHLNDCPARIIGDFILRDGRLFATPQELASFGLATPVEAGSAPTTPIALDDLPDVAWRIDHEAQAVYITAPPRCLMPNQLSLQAAGRATVDATATGWVLNYDITGNFTDPLERTGSTDLYGLFDARVFVPAGDLQTSFAAQRDAAGDRRVWRLDSSWQSVDPERMRRLVVGDFISRGPSWSRPLRMGGIQWRSDFALQPELITFPLPALGGSTAVPSTLDVLVDGNRILSSGIPAGPFEIADVPVINGAGDISMTITDIFGRQQQVTLPFYASRELLRPGLTQYSLEIGALRRNWGTASLDYGEAAMSASVRRGITTKTTLEGHAEATRELALVGFGAVRQVAGMATLDFSMSGSRTGGLSGSRSTVGINHVSRGLSLGASAAFASDGFRDIAAQADGLITKRRWGAYAGVSLRRLGNLQLAYNDAERVDLLSPTVPVHRVRLLNASFSRQTGLSTWQASAYRDFADGGGDGVYLSFSLSLGSNSVASVSASETDGRPERRFDASRVADRHGDFGYQIHASDADTDRFFALGHYRRPWGQLSAGAERLGDTDNLRLGLRGSVIAAGGVLKAADPVDDSFAVVRTGLPDVRVLRENREVGRTDDRGVLLVTDLRPYQANSLAIMVDDLPAEAVVSEDAVTVRPRERSGVTVEFDIKVGAAGLLRLVDESGAPLPLGSSLRLSESDILSPVGHEGIAFVEGLEPGSRYDGRVLRPDGRTCVVRFMFEPQPGRIADLGTVRCVERSR